jgi:PAS domain S-box-containing protein
MEIKQIPEIDIAVILTDAKREILWVNSDFTRITGYSLREVEGKKPGSLLQGKNTDPRDVKVIRERLSAEVPFRHQILNYRKNGEAYLCRLVIQPIFDTRQEISHFLAFEVDGDHTATEALDIPLREMEAKYNSSSLKGVEEIRLFLKLKDYLEKDRPFLDPNMSLKHTADHLHTNTKYLSQVVNRLSHHNFQYFINTFRVNEAKRQLLCGEFGHLTLYGIALQCGFKNKSTFYKVFKEVAHMTPRQFIMLHKNRSN